MPQNPPPTTQAFITAVSFCTWQATGFFVNNDTGGTFGCESSDGAAWTLVGSAGMTTNQATALLLVGATANANGTFTHGGIAYWLEIVSGQAQAVRVRA